MQSIQFSANYSGGATCKVATFPRVGQSTTTIAVGSGATPTDIFEALEAGDQAYLGGQIYKDSDCYGLRIEATFIGDSDCSTCPSSASPTTTTQTFDIPAGAVSFPIPEGFYQELTVTLLDSTGTPVNAASQAVKVGWYSTYTPSCPSCYVLAV
jgi:hypothetical protein